MHNQMGINYARLFQFIGNDTTYEMWLSGTQCGHQIVQLLLVGRRYSGKATTLFTTTFGLGGGSRLTWMVGEDFHKQFVRTLLVQIDDGVVQGILVLFQPTGDVVWYVTGIMANGEMGGLLTWFWLLWFGEVWRFPQVVAVQFFLKSLFGGFRARRFFL